MPIQDVCTKNVTCLSRDNTIEEAARLMRKNNVGSIVIVDQKADGVVPVGIITDRDVVVEVIAKGYNPKLKRVDEVMNRSLKAVNESDGLYEVLHFLQKYRVNRAPVINSSGKLVGIISTDDALELISDELMQIARLKRGQRMRTKMIREESSSKFHSILSKQKSAHQTVIHSSSVQ